MWQDDDENGDKGDDNQGYFELELSGSGQDIMAMFMSNILDIWTAAVVSALKYLT